MNSSATKAEELTIKQTANNDDAITLEEAEIELAQQLLRAHNCLHNTNITWEHVPSWTKTDLQFKARAVLEWIGNNAHRITN